MMNTMLDLPLRAVPLAFLDFETTGLFPHRGDRVCEVALQRVVGATVESSFVSLVDPQRPLSAQSFSVNGIGPEQLAGAPTFAEVAAPVRTVLAGAAIVAHNAPFDVEFLHAELSLAGAPPFFAPAIDTLAIARRLFPRRRSHSLGALAQELGIPPPSHRAMDAVLALRAGFADLAAHLEALAVTTLGDLLRYARGFDPGDPEPPPPPPIDGALREGRLLRIVYSSRSSPDPTERIVRPIEIFSQRGTFFLRAYCYFRQALRTFVIEKIQAMDVV